MFNFFQKKPIIAILGKNPKELESITKELTQGKYSWKKYDISMLKNPDNLALTIEFSQLDIYVFPKKNQSNTIYPELDPIPFKGDDFSNLIFNLLLSQELQESDYYFNKIHDFRTAYLQNRQKLDFSTHKTALELFYRTPFLVDDYDERQTIIEEINIFYKKAIEQYSSIAHKQKLTWEMALFNFNWNDDYTSEYRKILESLVLMIDKKINPYEYAFAKFQLLKNTQKFVDETSQVDLFEFQVEGFQEIKSLINKEKHLALFVNVLYELGYTYKNLVERDYEVSTIEKAIEVYKELIPILDKEKDYDNWLQSHNGYANVVLIKASMNEDFDLAGEAVQLYAKIKHEFHPEKDASDYAMFQQNFATAALTFAELANEKTRLKLIPLTLEHLDNAIKIWTYEDYPEFHAIVLSNIAKTTALMGETKQDPGFYYTAIEKMKIAAEINLIENHNNVAVNNRKLGEYYYKAGKLTDNEDDYRNSIKYLKLSLDGLNSKKNNTGGVITFYLFRSYYNLVKINTNEKECLEALAIAEDYLTIKDFDKNKHRYYNLRIKKLDVLSMLCSVSPNKKRQDAFNILNNEMEKLQFDEFPKSVSEEYKRMIKTIRDKHEC